MSATYSMLRQIRIGQDAAYRERKDSADLLSARGMHNSTIAGLIAKEQEITNKIKKESAAKKPDQERLRRLYEIQANLRATLARCR